MKTITFSLLCIAFSVHLMGQRVIRHNVVYQHDDKAMTDLHKKELKDLTADLEAGNRVMVYPLTYDSARGRLEFVKNAQVQAQEIADYCSNIGFEVLGQPKNFPNAIHGMSIAISLRYNPAKPTDYGLASQYPEKPSQFFVIDPNEDNLLEGDEGTKLFIPAGTMASKKDVKIELKEYYSLADYMKGGLPTVSNGKMLITGGSMYLNATDAKNEDQKVNLKPGKGIDVEFTNGKEDDQMEVFIKDPNSKELNWIRQRRVSRKGSWKMTKVVYNYDGSVKEELVFNSPQEWKAYQEEQKRLAEERERQRREYEAQLAKEAKEQEERNRKLADARNAMQNSLKVNNLGFINCDRFPDEPMQPLMVRADKDVLAEYYLVYNDVRGVMNGRLAGTLVNFGSVPRDLPAKLIAVSFIDGKAYYYETAFKAGDREKPSVDLKEVPKSFVDEQLASLN